MSDHRVSEYNGCEVTGVWPPNCRHCAALGEFLAREGLPARWEDAALQLLSDALFLRVNGERPPGAPQLRPEAETWAGWDRKAELFLRLRRGDEEAMDAVEQGRGGAS